MDSRQRRTVVRALWIIGAVAVVVAIAATAWWQWNDRRHHQRHTSLISDVQLSGEGRTLSVATSWRPHCDGARPQLQAQESSTTVTLTLKLGEALRTPCDDETVGINQVSVTLQSPLNGRRLIDASTGRDLKPSAK
ncbi:hypothetical protein [Streptomyces cinnamoneus]|uniref:Uncharacterized protein n=1 Tax=Streptomyces cinnamoneus TaxID=53446 RepID=A0A918TF49_STRCJ|nr:hypothetical protein [Streptomyces cinnamoneus]GHC44929.1 hypothetical protein GCM10010507_20060 [Streptomyces cinnamoneus]